MTTNEPVDSLHMAFVIVRLYVCVSASIVGGEMKHRRENYQKDA